MSGVSEEEIERLANRLAMLVSDGGEADNAGRAVGALARRLGLTGGQLKAIFMAGAESAAAQTARVRRLEREIARLRERLEAAEAEAETLRRERDELSREGVALQAALTVQGRNRRMRRLAVGTIVLLAASGGALVAFGPKLRVGDEPVQAAGAPVYHTATVHDRPAALRRDPDPAAPVLAMLPPGTRLAVHRTIWRNLTQWVEVGEGDTTGFVLSTEVDLS
jgi:hypothetical protein